MKITASERFERIAQKRTTVKNFDALIEVYTATRNSNPKNTISELVNRLGYAVAVEVVAELVNSVGAWDARVGTKVRAWAMEQPTAASREELDEAGIYQPSAIHPAHIEQLALVTMAYKPDPERDAMRSISSVKKRIEAKKTRGAWSKGVSLYALELLEELAENREYQARERSAAVDFELQPLTLQTELLNGAECWTEYSFGGSALICNYDIAERLCSPSELKKTRNGERQPNIRESWLDVQARALYQAYRLIRSMI